MLHAVYAIPGYILMHAEKTIANYQQLACVEPVHLYRPPSTQVARITQW